MTIHPVAPFHWKARGCTPAPALCLVAGMLLVAAPAEAQISMSVSPIRADHAVPAGQMRTNVITAENQSSRPLRVRVTVADWYLEQDGTPVFVKRGTHPGFSMSRWVDVNPTEFEVPAADTQVIRYTLTIPEGTPGASYRTALLVESLPDFVDAPEANVAYLTTRFGVIIYNRVGNPTPEVEITGQALVTDREALGLPAVRLTVRNPGLVNVRVSGESRILDSAGRVLQRLPIPDAVVLPQSERDLVLRLDEPVTHPAVTILSRLDVGQTELLEVETRIGVLAASNEGVGR